MRDFEYIKMQKLPCRKSIRLKDYDYSSNGYYFVTICTQNREKLFGKIVGATLCGRPLTLCGRPYNFTKQFFSVLGANCNKIISVTAIIKIL